jgi:hypothetical protein
LRAPLLKRIRIFTVQHLSMKDLTDLRYQLKILQ